MLRRLHPDQPDSFAFTPANLAWAEAQIDKYPEGRQASAVIPLLWRAQEQEGWVTKPAIEVIAQMLGLASMRLFSPSWNIIAILFPGRLLLKKLEL